MNDLPLADLDAFTAVAAARSFRAAAKKRGVSASSLSEALRRLEAKLQVRLLNRTTRSVTLTEAGTRLLDRLTPALGEIAGALEQVYGFNQGGLENAWRESVGLPPRSAPTPDDSQVPGQPGNSSSAANDSDNTQTTLLVAGIIALTVALALAILLFGAGVARRVR